MRIRRMLCLITPVVVAAGCEQEARPFVSPIPFDTAAVTVSAGGSSARLLVEVARTPEQKALGLGVRPSLDEGSGMIFPYDAEQPGDAAYWMWRMHVPLDIAFLDSAGVVLHIVAAEPCTAVYVEGCPSYPPGVPYWAVLEANQGWFAENGLGEGAVVKLED